MNATVGKILIQAGQFLAPLQGYLAPGNARRFFLNFGIDLTDAQANSVAAPLKDISDQLGQFIEAINGLQATNENDVAGVIQKSLESAASLRVIVSKLPDVGNIINASGASIPAGILAKMPELLFNHLLVKYFYRLPFLNEALQLAGVLEVIDAGSDTDDPYSTYAFHFDKITDFISNPLNQLKSAYGWGLDSFDGVQLFKVLERIFGSLGFPALFDQSVSPATLDLLALTMTPTPGTPRGLLISFNDRIAPVTQEFSEAGWKMTLGLGLTTPSGTGMAILPSGALQFIPPTSSEISGTLSFRADASGTSADKTFRIINIPGATTLDVASVFIETINKFSWNASSSQAAATFTLGGGITGGHLHIGSQDADGFIGKILSGINLDMPFELQFGVSSSGGLYFIGSAGLTVQLPIHFSLGILDVTALSITAGIASGKLPVSLGANLKSELGPLTVEVDGIGLTIDLSLKNNRDGNLGPLDLGFSFKPPNGVGLSVDAGIIKGGGFLYFDNDRSEYAGVMELSIAAIVTVKAIGLITTRMPDGSKGFSLLVIITAEFGTGIQLGFGFTLLGVGGLLGLNRTMLLDPIAAGIKTGGINSIMFPPDPVANAARIISDLRTYFPPYEGRFLLGPMLKLGWGTPTLISISFGIIIEIPGNVAIVGVLRINLPDENIPIVVINVGFIGALEFDKSRIWFYAALFDSRILFMTMEGSMGLLMDFSDHPNFVLSVGGFHPAFQPPPLPFPNPTRIHIDVLRTPLARITVENYFAVTSNTVQFGARSELFYGVDGFDIHGNFSFDALFQFSPFHFVIDISFSVGMDVFGAGVFSVNLKLKLQGPAPWNARGTATLSIDLWLFSIDISVDFDISWGEADNPKLPAVDAIPILVTEFNKIDNWRASIPSSSNLLVTLRKLDSDAQKLVLHPLGTLQISQRTIPLDIQVDKVGANDVADAHLFTLKPPAALSGIKLTSSPPQEKFAIAQFQNLSDADKLSRPSFQDFDSGAELAFDGRQIGSAKLVKRIVRYEVKIIDGDDKTSRIRWFKNLGTLFFHWLAGSSVAKCSLSDASKKALVPTAVTDRVQLTKPGYVIASTTDNKQKQGTRVFASEAQARDFLILTISQTPTLTDELHIIPSFETSV